MGSDSIPVDLFNPGQVFACMGFLEAAEVLLGDAEGGFDWSDEANVRFHMRAAGEHNPFAAALAFIAEADLHRVAPFAFSDPPPKKKRTSKGEEDEDAEEDVPLSPLGLRTSESFPSRETDRMALPVRFESSGRPPIDLQHWTDGSSRNAFKLYAGNRSAYTIAIAMLRGTRHKPTKKESGGAVKTEGVAALWNRMEDLLVAQPFDVLTLMGGSFNFDPRGAWTALDAGYSPNEHKDHGVAASPLVEILAALGLEHARPYEYDTRRVRYAVWSGSLPPILARPVLGGAKVAVPTRTFTFVLELSGKNKVVTFAVEETNR
jgi:CRISPR-associated protein Csx14